jgi:hypothetical protein
MRSIRSHRYETIGALAMAVCCSWRPETAGDHRWIINEPHPTHFADLAGAHLPINLLIFLLERRPGSA